MKRITITIKICTGCLMKIVVLKMPRFLGGLLKKLLTFIRPYVWLFIAEVQGRRHYGFFPQGVKLYDFTALTL